MKNLDTISCRPGLELAKLFLAGMEATGAKESELAREAIENGLRVAVNKRVAQRRAAEETAAKLLGPLGGTSCALMRKLMQSVA